METVEKIRELEYDLAFEKELRESLKIEYEKLLANRMDALKLQDEKIALKNEIEQWKRIVVTHVDRIQELEQNVTKEIERKYKVIQMIEEQIKFLGSE